VHEPRVAARIARRIDALLAPLDETLRVGERALFLEMRGGGDEEDLGLDRQRIFAVGRGVP
jgi:hypothetical protein